MATIPSPPDPINGPKPPNQRQQPPRLINGGKHLVFLRDHHLKQDDPAFIHTYWGPNQDGPEYNPDGSIASVPPPGNWPRKGTILRVPRVARWFWEAGNADYQVVVAMGATGSYSYGQHYLQYDMDITTPSSIFPVHIHSKGLDQNGVSAYGTNFNISYYGYEDLTYVGVVEAKGNYSYWLYSAYLPPMSMKAYEDRTSDTYKAIALLWQILEGGFITPKPITQDGIPPITGTPDGPKSVGVCYPVRTGIYTINDIEYGEEVDLTTVGLSIPAGWAQPPLDPDNGEDASSNWGDLSDKLNKEYKGSTNPYFNAFPRPNGIDQFLDLVNPKEDGFFGCHTVNFILLSQVHDLPESGDERIARIRAMYPHMPTYVVVILIDTQNLADQEEAGSQAAKQFIDDVTGIAEGLADCGWFVEEVSYLEPDACEAIIKRYIKTYLHPELNDAPPDDKEPEDLQGSDDRQGDGS